MITVSKYRVGPVWYLRYSKELGLPRRSTGVRDKKLAEEMRMREQYRYLFAPPERPVKPIPLSDFAQQFREYKKGQGKARATVESYMHAMNNFGKFLKRDIRMDKITLDMIEAFAAARRGIGRAEKTIRNELIVLVTAFRWAKRQRFIRENPCDLLELPKKIKNPPRYLTREQYLKLKASINDELFKDVVDFYLLTGIRRSDGPRLLFSKHVDEERGVILLPQQKQKDYKTIHISEDLQAVIGRLKLKSKGDQLIPYLPDNLTGLFGKYVKKAGIPNDITFHALRHTFATWLASAGVGFSVIQALLGQSDPDSTKIYTHAYSEDMVGAINKLRLPKAELRIVN